MLPLLFYLSLAQSVLEIFVAEGHDAAGGAAGGAGKDSGQRHAVEGIIFGEDDIDVNDEEVSKIEEDNLKLRLLYDLKTYLGIKKDNIRRS